MTTPSPDEHELHQRIWAQEKAIRKLFRPLEFWLGDLKNYFTHEFPEELSPKLVDVPEQSLICPSLSSITNGRPCSSQTA